MQVSVPKKKIYLHNQIFKIQFRFNTKKFYFHNVERVPGFLNSCFLAINTNKPRYFKRNQNDVFPTVFHLEEQKKIIIKTTEKKLKKPKEQIHYTRYLLKRNEKIIFITHSVYFNWRCSFILMKI